MRESENGILEPIGERAINNKEMGAWEGYPLGGKWVLDRKRYGRSERFRRLQDLLVLNSKRKLG